MIEQMIKHVLVFCLMSFSALSVSAQIQMEVTADTNSILLGDRIKLTFTITCDPSISIKKLVLDSITTIPGFELSDEKEWVERKTQMSKILTKEMMFTAFEPGDYEFPAVPFFYDYQNTEKKGFSRPWRLKVLPMLNKSEDIAPNKDIVVVITFWDRFGVYIIISLAVILLGVLSALLVSYLKRRSKYTPRAPVMQISPAQKARKELALLRKNELWKAEDHKMFQTKLSLILRIYLQEAFDIPALKSTSHEIVSQLKKTGLPYNVIDTTDKALNIADLVKFAKAQSREEINFSFIGKVETLIDEAESFKGKIPDRYA